MYMVNQTIPKKSMWKLPERIIYQAEEKETWAFWINYKYRIKFIFLSDNDVLSLDIGTHDIYK